MAQNRLLQIQSENTSTASSRTSSSTRIGSTTEFAESTISPTSAPVVTRSRDPREQAKSDTAIPNPLIGIIKANGAESQQKFDSNFDDHANSWTNDKKSSVTVLEDEDYVPRRGHRLFCCDVRSWISQIKEHSGWSRTKRRYFIGCCFMTLLILAIFLPLTFLVFIPSIARRPPWCCNFQHIRKFIKANLNRQCHFIISLYNSIRYHHSCDKHQFHHAPCCSNY